MAAFLVDYYDSAFCKSNRYTLAFSNKKTLQDIKLSILLLKCFIITVYVRCFESVGLVKILNHLHIRKNGKTLPFIKAYRSFIVLFHLESYSFGIFGGTVFKKFEKFAA